MTNPELKMCVDCGEHPTCWLEDSYSGEMIHEYDRCKACILGFGPKGWLRRSMPEIEQIVINDTTVINEQSK